MKGKILTACSFIYTYLKSEWAQTVTGIFVFPAAYYAAMLYLNRDKKVAWCNELPNTFRLFLGALGGFLLVFNNSIITIVGVLFLLLAIFADDEAMRRTYRNKGVLVFSGLDGAGKSTHALHLQKWLRKKGYSCRYVLFSNYLFLTNLSKLKTRSKQPDTKPLFTDPTITKTSKLHFVRPYLATLDNLLTYLLKVVPSVWRNEIVICDRFIWNGYVKHKALGYKTPFLFTFSTLIKPKHGVMFTVPYKVAVKRIIERSWHHPAYLPRQYGIEREEYRKIADKLGFSTINTNKPIRDAWKDVTSSMLL